ncbi:MAG: sigma-70 family RNA polymerase sigma factor [Bacteroidia bacterium]|nr:sigma-70 family RNA polymerase sigma factor [Bacteroidia bacterium]
MFGVKKYNDLELIQEIKKGNKAALSQLYNDNYNAARGHILKNSGTQDDVDDVLQDAVIVIWEKIKNGNLILEAKLSTFLFAIVRNQWLKKLNKAGKVDRMNDWQTEKLSETRNFQDMDLKKVKDMVMELGDACRQVLSMFYFEEMDMESIAKRLNYANSDTVKAKKYQCFKKLQENFLARYKKSDFLS